MRTAKLQDFKMGWFIGDFEPSLFRSPHFEVGHHHYKQGFKSTPHTHLLTTEVNYIVKGTLMASGQNLGPGDIFIYDPGDPSDVEFLEDTDLIIVKFPSIPSDKVLL